MAEPARPEPKVLLRDEDVARGTQWYRATYFGHAHEATAILGDKSTSYLECAQAAHQAQQMFGDPLILVQLREPIARAISHWKFSSENGFESRPLWEALSADRNTDDDSWEQTGLSVSPYAYLRRGRYLDYLPTWLDRFDQHRVQFVEEWGLTQIKELYKWLGVDSEITPGRLTELSNRSARGTLATLTTDQRSELSNYFAPYNRALEQYLGRTLPWGESS
jgi:hypothetical protein